VWAAYPSFDIFVRDLASDSLSRLTDSPGYDAEATVSADGKSIVFTSLRDGDLDVYTMDADGRNVRRLTTELGYDGGPFFSPDGQWICYRAFHPADSTEAADYRSLLTRYLLRPTRLDLWVMRRDGSDKRQVTHLPGASFAPYFAPDGKRLIFASNHEDPHGRGFDLYLVNLDGGGLERVTTEPTFDGFPMFSPDGRFLAFSSNRGAARAGDTNVFIAEWKE
jgi:Tol biopolymer transport system component